MRKAKSIFQGKNEPVWVRPSCLIVLIHSDANLVHILYPRCAIILFAQY